MTTSATYIGPNGLDGYKVGQQYTLLIRSEGRSLHILVAAPHGEPKTYSSQAAFNKHWHS